MANKFYGAIALTGGGTGALDKIDGQVLSDGDGAMCVDATNNVVYFYTLNGSGSDGESSPTVILPDSNPGTPPTQKQWDLVATYEGAALTDNRIPKADGTLGKLQNTGISCDDSNNLTGINNATLGGTLGVTGATTLTGLLTANGDLKLDAAGGLLEHNQSSPTGTVVMGYNGYFYATKVYNPVYQVCHKGV
jgi:hypothetical protein